MNYATKFALLSIVLITTACNSTLAGPPLTPNGLSRQSGITPETMPLSVVAAIRAGEYPLPSRSILLPPSMVNYEPPDRSVAFLQANRSRRHRNSTLLVPDKGGQLGRTLAMAPSGYPFFGGYITDGVIFPPNFTLPAAPTIQQSANSPIKAYYLLAPTTHLPQQCFEVGIMYRNTQHFAAVPQVFAYVYDFCRQTPSGQGEFFMQPITSSLITAYNPTLPFTNGPAIQFWIKPTGSAGGIEGEGGEQVGIIAGGAVNWFTDSSGQILTENYPYQKSRQDGWDIFETHYGSLGPCPYIPPISEYYLDAYYTTQAVYPNIFEINYGPDMIGAGTQTGPSAEGPLKVIGVGQCVVNDNTSGYYYSIAPIDNVGDWAVTSSSSQIIADPTLPPVPSPSPQPSNVPILSSVPPSTVGIQQNLSSAVQSYYLVNGTPDLQPSVTENGGYAGSVSEAVRMNIATGVAPQTSSWVEFGDTAGEFGTSAEEQPWFGHYIAWQSTDGTYGADAIGQPSPTGIHNFVINPNFPQDTDWQMELDGETVAEIPDPAYAPAVSSEAYLANSNILFNSFAQGTTISGLQYQDLNGNDYFWTTNGLTPQNYLYPTADATFISGSAAVAFQNVSAPAANISERNYSGFGKAEFSVRSVATRILWPANDDKRSTFATSGRAEFGPVTSHATNQTMHRELLRYGDLSLMKMRHNLQVAPGRMVWFVTIRCTGELSTPIGAFKSGASLLNVIDADSGHLFAFRVRGQLIRRTSYRLLRAA